MKVSEMPVKCENCVSYRTHNGGEYGTHYEYCEAGHQMRKPCEHHTALAELTRQAQELDMGY